MDDKPLREFLKYHVTYLINIYKQLVMTTNIALIVCDTLSAFHLPFYGYDKETAPFLSSLVAENTVFQFAYANAPWTVPSHASLFSGQEVAEHGTTGGSLSFTADSFVSKLSEQGYQTYGFSNNGLIGEVLGFDEGFDTFYSNLDIRLGSTASLPALREVQRKNARNEYDSNREKYMDAARKMVQYRDISSAYVYFKKQLAARGITTFPGGGAETTNKIVKDELAHGAEPFFLFINYMEPHFPYTPPKEYVEDDIAYDETVNYIRDLNTNYPFEMEMLERDVPEEVQDNMRSLYDGEIRRLDSHLKDLYTSLVECFPDTIFIFISDHGELTGEMNRFGHQFGLHEKVLRVPLIIAGKAIENKTIAEKHVSLKELKDFITGEKTVDELGSDTVYAEYNGYAPLYEHWGYGAVTELPEEQQQVLKNQAKSVIHNKSGFIQNTHTPHLSFTVHPDKCEVPETRTDMALKKKLERRLQTEEAVEHVDF